MTVQVSLRLDERLVAQVDELVQTGEARSRAEVFESALERELRRRLYEHDAQLYAEQGEDPETQEFLEWARGRAHPDVDEREQTVA